MRETFNYRDLIMTRRRNGTTAEERRGMRRKDKIKKK